MVNFKAWDTTSTGGKRKRPRIPARLLIALSILLIVIAGIMVYVVRALPHMAAAQIGRMTNTRVELGDFDFHLDGSVSIDGLVIRPMQEASGYDNTILRAGNVEAQCSRRSLMRFSPRLMDVRIEGFTLDAQFDLDTEEWNVGTLRVRPSRGGGHGVPAIQLRQGKLRYCKVSGGKVDVAISMPLEATFGQGTGSSYDFNIKTAKLSGGYGESHLEGHWQPGEFVLAGGLSSADIPSLERAWAVDVLAAEVRYDQTGAYTLGLRMTDLHGKQTPEVATFERIAPAGADASGPLGSIQRFFGRYRPTGTVGSIELKARGNLRELRDSEVVGTLVCKDVSICHSRFPYEIDHLTGSVEFTQSSAFIDRLRGRHGQVDIQIEGWTRGFGAERQYQYHVTSDNVILDETLYAALQPGHKRMWDTFQPSGTIAANYRLVRTPPDDKRMSLSVDLKDVAATFREFPYPLTRLTGRLHFDRDGVTVSEVVSAVEGHRIELDGKVTQHAGGHNYYLSVDANDIPLDATLAEALPSRHREMYRRFDANGVAHIRARIFNADDANDVGTISFLADVSCNAKSLELKEIPLALSNVTAQTSITPESLSIKKFVGSFGHTEVTATGGMQFAGDDGSRRYRMSVTASPLPLDEVTLGLLPESVASQVAAFRPEGDVNAVIDVTADGNEPPDYVLMADCLGGRISHERFAYPLQDVRGTIEWANDNVAFKNITARPVGDSLSPPQGVLRIDGSATLAEQGLAEAAFTLQGSDLSFAERLGEVLPKDLADMYRTLSPEGTFDLDVTKLKVSGASGDETLVEYAGTAQLDHCRLKISSDGMDVCGQLEVEAVYDMGRGVSDGRMRLDAEAITLKEKTITNTTVDAIYDPDAKKWLANDFLGDCYGGKLLGTLEIARADDAWQYLLRLALNRVDLRQFLMAGKTGVFSEKLYSGGVMNAMLSLGARIGDETSRRGACQVDITNMQVGKVSPFSNLLSVLRLSEPTDYTFDRMLIDSYLKQDQLLIRTLDVSGRNVAFTGSGTMDLSSDEVNLTLTTRGRRMAATEPSILQSLTEGLGGAVVRMEVTGKASDPRVQTKALPVIEDSLKVLGAPE